MISGITSGRSAKLHIQFVCITKGNLSHSHFLLFLLLGLQVPGVCPGVSGRQVNLKSPVYLTSISLDCGRKHRPRRKPTSPWGEHANSTFSQFCLIPISHSATFLDRWRLALPIRCLKWYQSFKAATNVTSLDNSGCLEESTHWKFWLKHNYQTPALASIIHTEPWVNGGERGEWGLSLLFLWRKVLVDIEKVVPLRNLP